MTDSKDNSPKDTTSYKVWLEIERYDEHTDASEDMDAPGGALAEFATYEEAYAFACVVTNVHAEPLSVIQESGDWELPYSITSVCRNDVLMRFSKEQVARLTDADMQRLARKMEDAYVQHQFWEDLELFTGQMLDEKEMKNHEEDES